MQKCCAYGKRDEDKFLTEIDTVCPEGSEEVSWDYNFSMDYDMDMMMHHMGDMHMAANGNMDMHHPLDLDFDLMHLV